LNDYSPLKPYLFQSGKRAGESLEVLIFKDYSFLRWLHREILKETPVKKNNLQLHLEWLLERGEEVKTNLLCPICGQNKVEFFYIRRSDGDISLGTSYTSCNQCIDEAEAMGLNIIPERYPLKFSSLSHFRRGERKMVSKLFQQVFLPPGRLTKERAFKLFIG